MGRQVNMDYSLVHAVHHRMDHQQWVVNFYDINCQYSKNLHQRIEGNQFVSLPPRLKIQLGIGIWHVHGHQSECFVRYSPNFIPGVGNVDGEIMEILVVLKYYFPLHPGNGCPSSAGNAGLPNE